MTYRIVSNEAERHPQWIIVRALVDGRPIMTHGPFVTRAAAWDMLTELQEHSFRRFYATIERAARAVRGRLRPAAVAPRPIPRGASR